MYVVRVWNTILSLVQMCIPSQEWEVILPDVKSYFSGWGTLLQKDLRKWKESMKGKED